MEPFLHPLPPDQRQRVEQGLEAIRQDPFGEETYPWKGRGDPVLFPSTTRTSVIDGPDEKTIIEVIYAPYVDYPLLAPIALLPLIVPEVPDSP